MPRHRVDKAFTPVPEAARVRMQTQVVPLRVYLAASHWRLLDFLTAISNDAPPVVPLLRILILLDTVDCPLAL